MNSALLALTVSVALPIAVMEVRRKWRDLHHQPGVLLLASGDGVDRDWIASRIAEHSFTPGPVWIGIDLSSGDDRCVEHDGNGYVVDTNHAPGNFADFPPSESTSGGACE